MSSFWTVILLSHESKLVSFSDSEYKSESIVLDFLEIKQIFFIGVSAVAAIAPSSTENVEEQDISDYQWP